MKLLFVIPEYLPDHGGGIITFYRHLLPELVRQGHSVQAVVSDGRHIGDPECEIGGVAVKYIGAATHGKWLRQFARYQLTMPWLQQNLALAWAAWETASEGDGYDHVETTDWPLLFAPWIAHRERVPCTVQLHGSHGQIALDDVDGRTLVQDGFVRLLEVAMLREALSLQSNSRLNGAAWETRLGRKVETEYPPFALAHRGKAEERVVRRPLSAAVFARLHVGKGAIRLAETMDVAGRADFKVDWFGTDTRYSSEFPSTAAYLKERYPQTFPSRFEHHKGVPNDIALARMASASFVLIPSLFDVFNLTCAEAMSLGSIVVCSKQAGAHELIEHGVNGFFYDPLDDSALSEVVKRIESLSVEEVRAFGKRAAETIFARLSPLANVARRVEYYRGVMVMPRKPLSDDWVSETSRPSNKTVDRVELLERFGVRELSTALSDRIGAKVGLRIRGAASELLHSAE